MPGPQSYRRRLSSFSDVDSVSDHGFLYRRLNVLLLQCHVIPNEWLAFFLSFFSLKLVHFEHPPKSVRIIAPFGCDWHGWCYISVTDSVKPLLPWLLLARSVYTYNHAPCHLTGFVQSHIRRFHACVATVTSVPPAWLKFWHRLSRNDRDLHWWVLLR